MSDPGGEDPPNGSLLPPRYSTLVPLHVSQRRRGSELSPETAANIDRANALDRELYEHVSTLFEMSVRDAGPGFASEVGTFRRQNRCHIKRYAPYPIDLNSASLEQLLLLPGVGPAIARSIIAYRAAHPFGAAEELRNVTGVGEARCVRLLDLVVA